MASLRVPTPIVDRMIPSAINEIQTIQTPIFHAIDQ
jgi:hypothetical protein